MNEKSTRRRRPPREHDERDALDFHAEDVLDRPFDRGLALRLLKHVLPHRRYLFISLALITVSSILSLLGPLFVKEAIDGPISGAVEGGGTPMLRWISSLAGIPAPGEAALSTSERGRWLLAVVAVYGIVLLLLFVTRYFQTVVMNRTGQSVMRDLRLKLFRHLQRQSLAYYQKNPVGRLVTRVTSDVESLNELFTSGVVTILGDSLTLVGIVVLLFVFNPPLALVALSVTPALILVTALFRAMARRHFREITRRRAHLSAFTQESIIGMDVIQISRREDAQAERYGQISERYLRAYLGSIFWYAIFFPAVEILSATSLALVVWKSGDQVVLGTTTFGEFFLFWSFLNKFFAPARELADKYNLLQQAMASSERVFRILDSDTALPEQAEPAPARPFSGAIEFQNISFAYDGRNPVLEEISFRCERGETVALVGATGAGKSTIVNLLLRFYDPAQGKILIDGRDIREFSLAEHRQRFGLVLQDVSIFSRSVRENIDLDREIPLDVVDTACRQANAGSFIDRLPDGLSEMMKERGRTLSSGERQLLSFARALAGDPEILILDEATSHIDTETELLIQDALSKLVEGRTSLIIAHRLSTIRKADRILVFHHGRLREQGTHAELLARDGIYARLYRLQFESE